MDYSVSTPPLEGHHTGAHSAPLSIDPNTFSNSSPTSPIGSSTGPGGAIPVTMSRGGGSSNSSISVGSPSAGIYAHQYQLPPQHPSQQQQQQGIFGYSPPSSSPLAAGVVHAARASPTTGSPLVSPFRQAQAPHRPLSPFFLQHLQQQQQVQQKQQNGSGIPASRPSTMGSTTSSFSASSNPFPNPSSFPTNHVHMTNGNGMNQTMYETAPNQQAGGMSVRVDMGMSGTNPGMSVYHPQGARQHIVTPSAQATEEDPFAYINFLADEDEGVGSNSMANMIPASIGADSPSIFDGGITSIDSQSSSALPIPGAAPTAPPMSKSSSIASQYAASPHQPPGNPNSRRRLSHLSPYDSSSPGSSDYASSEYEWSGASSYGGETTGSEDMDPATLRLAMSGLSAGSSSSLGLNQGSSPTSVSAPSPFRPASGPSGGHHFLGLPPSVGNAIAASRVGTCGINDVGMNNPVMLTLEQWMASEGGGIDPSRIHDGGISGSQGNEDQLQQQQQYQHPNQLASTFNFAEPFSSAMQGLYLKEYTGMDLAGFEPNGGMGTVRASSRALPLLAKMNGGLEVGTIRGRDAAVRGFEQGTVRGLKQEMTGVGVGTIKASCGPFGKGKKRSSLKSMATGKTRAPLSHAFLTIPTEEVPEPPEDTIDPSHDILSSSAPSALQPSLAGPIRNSHRSSRSPSANSSRDPSVSGRAKRTPVTAEVPYHLLPTKRTRGRKVPKWTDLTFMPNTSNRNVQSGAVQGGGGGVAVPTEALIAYCGHTKTGKLKKWFGCPVEACHGVFRRSEHFKRHVRTVHLNEKPYACKFPGCGKTFSRNDNLKQHMRVHDRPGEVDSGNSFVPALTSRKLKAKSKKGTIRAKPNSSVLLGAQAHGDSDDEMDSDSDSE